MVPSDSPTSIPRHFGFGLIGGVTRLEIGPGDVGASRVTPHDCPCMPPLRRRGAGGGTARSIRPRGSLRPGKRGSALPLPSSSEGSDVTALHVGSLALRPAGLRRLPERSLCRAASRRRVAPPPRAPRY